jgi:hypothetical protein
MNPIEPEHYKTKSGTECWKVQLQMLGKEQMIGYWRGCIIKYLFRYKSKNGIEDLQKAKKCIDFLISLENKNENMEQVQKLR